MSYRPSKHGRCARSVAPGSPSGLTKPPVSAVQTADVLPQPIHRRRTALRRRRNFWFRSSLYVVNAVLRSVPACLINLAS